jgi:hypothetical protein
MRVVIGAALAACALVVGVQGAAAESHAVIQRTDPSASSPAGVIYQIPLDSARRDAAPVLPIGSRHNGSGGGGAGGGAGSGGGSSRAGGGGGSGQSAQVAEGGGTAGNPSSIHSENGFGSSSQVPGLSRAALQSGAGVPAAHTAGSTLPTYLLLVLIAVAAVAAGVLATGLKRRSEAGAGGRPTAG